MEEQNDHGGTSLTEGVSVSVSVHASELPHDVEQAKAWHRRAIHSLVYDRDRPTSERTKDVLDTEAILIAAVRVASLKEAQDVALNRYAFNLAGEIAALVGSHGKQVLSEASGSAQSEAQDSNSHSSEASR
jgi:hypothetical protein